jgi:Entner-Doudoroff aldolase
MSSQSEIISRLINPGIVAVVRALRHEQVQPLSEALIAGGVTAIEITMTTPGAIDALRETRTRIGSRGVVGVGTVLDVATCRAAIEAGAEFVVSPILRTELVALAHAADRPIMLGAYTPTEAQLAHEAGADFIKIFPADTLGPGYIKSLRAPLPHLRIVPTGGVDAGNVAEWFKAGCAAVGAGWSLVPLSAFSRYETTNTPLNVAHQSQFAAATISFNLPPDVSLSHATDAVFAALDRIGVPTGIHGTFQGTARAFQASLDNQPFLILAALIAVYLVLGMLYESVVHPITILSTLPSAGVGAILALLLFGSELNIISLIGVTMGTLITNAILIEYTFSIPGMFSLMTQALGNADLPVIEGVAIAGALLVVAANLAADVVHAWLDPRVRMT